MSVTTCKTVCREIEEADYGENPTASAMEHLRGCERCQMFYDERLKLRQLVASLETVAAPADFDLRVRSRIANGRGDTGFWFSNFSFGIPSVALASLVLLVGLVFAVKVWNTPSTDTVAGQADTSKSSVSGSEVRPGPSPEPIVTTVAGNPELAITNDDRSTTQRDRKPKKRSNLNSAVASVKEGSRITTREFSITPPPLIKKEDAVASLESSPVFQIETSSQPLRLSLDYSGGVSRTISVPALSFGSERVLSGSNLVKTSSKGAW